MNRLIVFLVSWFHALLLDLKNDVMILLILNTRQNIVDCPEPKVMCCLTHSRARHEAACCCVSHCATCGQ
jgi:hypothetical protein